jgi:hypothetical protein
MFKLYDFCFVTDDNATVSVKTWTIVAAHYPQMPPSENNGDITGSTLSANAAVRKKTRASLVAHYPQFPPSEKNGDITGSMLSANAA